MAQKENTNIADCIVFRPDIHRDGRGIFTEIYKRSVLNDFQLVQSNYSMSEIGVLRGIHKTPYAKLITCVSGKIYDVCVDLRPDSKTYKQTFSIELSGDNLISLYIPPYCGHGFLSLETSIVIYHQEQEYDKNKDIAYCYKNFSIKWPMEPIIVSQKDQDACI